MAWKCMRMQSEEGEILEEIGAGKISDLIVV